MADRPVSNPIHHIELWTDDLAAGEVSWGWLLGALGWTVGDRWTGGVSWRHAAGPYLVLEQSSAVQPGGHDRMRAGLNHLAVTCASHDELDALRVDAVPHGWSELFADRYPHAGGRQHTALFLENAQGFEVEIVVPRDQATALTPGA
ncbi:VOC family protein [Nakamurella sp. A5-74]|uniref:VOC family protein n=1 Tax=Nakamurella sp. A5-74 TaxID=3158264 RepID=A0AAU8DUT3_9ACTN